MFDLSPGKYLLLLSLVAGAFLFSMALGYGVDMGLFVALMVFVATVMTIMLLPGHMAQTEPPQFIPPQADTVDVLENTRFRDILDALADPFLIVDRGKVAFANRAMLDLLGAHIVGEDARVAIRHPAAAESLSRAGELTESVTIDIVGLGARDQRWQLQIIPVSSPAPFAEQAGRPRLLVRLIDQSAGFAAERARVDFVANASHELRTPLAAILGFIETLGDPKAGGDQETRQRFLAIMEAEAKRMQQLVDDLMSLSRIEADKHRTPKEEVDLTALAEEVVAIARTRLKRGQDIITELPDHPLTALGDRSQLTQLLHNLIDNAAKYGKDDTPIIVRLKHRVDNMACLDIVDEGEGIAPEHIPRLTERFYRVDSGRSRALGGTGLGLAIVKHIVERHRGRLSIESTPGKGSCVSVVLPSR